MSLCFEGLFEVLEVLGCEGLVEGWGSWKCGANGDGLRLVGHDLEESNDSFYDVLVFLTSVWKGKMYEAQVVRELENLG